MAKKILPARWPSEPHHRHAPVEHVSRLVRWAILHTSKIDSMLVTLKLSTMLLPDSSLPFDHETQIIR